jgi:hypothetical protein
MLKSELDLSIVLAEKWTGSTRLLALEVEVYPILILFGFQKLGNYL